MKSEWYENSEWNTEIAENFEQKLKRSSKYHRPQYMLVQAKVLIENRIDVSRELVEKVLKEYKEDEFSYANAMNLMGDIAFASQEYAEAESYYRYVQYDLKAEFRKHMKNGFDGSDIKLIKIILITKQEDKYGEAYELVKNHDIDLDFFKSLKFDFAYHASWLCSEMNKKDEARKYAQIALDLLNDPSPSSPNHPDVGNIHATKEQIDFIERLAST